MLLNLKTIHQPETLDAAVALLKDAHTFPLYGGAALQRHPRRDVEAVVDLGKLGLDYIRDSENSLRLGTMLTLERIRQLCLERAEQHPYLGGVAALLKEEMPETLRNTFTLGDLLLERDPQSPTWTGFLALGAVLKRVDVDMHYTAAAWLDAPEDVWRALIAHVRIPRGPQQAAVAYEKVSRTPADAPIVGAVAAMQVEVGGARHTALALCGVAATPVLQADVARVFDASGDVDRALDRLELDPPDDHWGSAEYRREMARVVARRALLRAANDVS